MLAFVGSFVHLHARVSFFVYFIRFLKVTLLMITNGNQCTCLASGKLDKENNQYSQVEQSVEAVSKPGLANTRLADLMST